MPDAWSSPDSWMTDFYTPAISSEPMEAFSSPGKAVPGQPNLLTSSWDSIEKFFGIHGKTFVPNTATMTANQAAAVKTAQLGQNIGILTSIMGAANQAIGSFYAAKTKQYEEKSAASSYEFQSDMAAINSRQAEYAAQSTLEAGKSQVQQYTMAAGQQEAETTASMAARGIALGQGSARDVSASQDLIKKMDVLTINSNATRQAWEQRMQASNFASQSALDRVSAQNARAGAGSISPFSAATTSLLDSATQFASQWDYRRKLQLQLGGKDPYYGYGTSGAYTPVGPGR